MRVPCGSDESNFVRLRTLHSRCHRVEDLEGRADIRTNSWDVLLLPAHVAILRTTGLWKQEIHRYIQAKRLQLLEKIKLVSFPPVWGHRWEEVQGYCSQKARGKNYWNWGLHRLYLKTMIDPYFSKREKEKTEELSVKGNRDLKLPTITGKFNNIY